MTFDRSNLRKFSTYYKRIIDCPKSATAEHGERKGISSLHPCFKVLDLSLMSGFDNRTHYPLPTGCWKERAWIM
jgi:hypothetical protein